MIKSVEEIERAAPPRRAPPSSRQVETEEEDFRPRASRRPPADEPASAPGIGRTYSGINVVAPEDALNDARVFVRELRSSDKLAFVGAAGTVFLAFLPWKETAAEGEILGLMSLGFLNFIANLLAMGAIVVRVRNAMPRLNPVIPWLVQLGTICFGIVWSLIFMKLSYDGQQVPALIGNSMVAVSSPSFGVYLALLTQLVALAGTLLGLKEKPA